jgi:hypothetical protein
MRARAPPPPRAAKMCRGRLRRPRAAGSRGAAAGGARGPGAWTARRRARGAPARAAHVFSQHQKLASRADGKTGASRGCSGAGGRGGGVLRLARARARPLPRVAAAAPAPAPAGRAHTGSAARTYGSTHGGHNPGIVSRPGWGGGRACGCRGAGGRVPRCGWESAAGLAVGRGAWGRAPAAARRPRCGGRRGQCHGGARAPESARARAAAARLSMHRRGRARGAQGVEGDTGEGRTRRRASGYQIQPGPRDTGLGGGARRQRGGGPQRTGRRPRGRARARQVGKRGWAGEGGTRRLPRARRAAAGGGRQWARRAAGALRAGRARAAHWVSEGGVGLHPSSDRVGVDERRHQRSRGRAGGPCMQKRQVGVEKAIAWVAGGRPCVGGWGGCSVPPAPPPLRARLRQNRRGGTKVSAHAAGGPQLRRPAAPARAAGRSLARALAARARRGHAGAGAEH